MMTEKIVVDYQYHTS